MLSFSVKNTVIFSLFLSSPFLLTGKNVLSFYVIGAELLPRRITGKEIPVRLETRSS